jgi:hypothetical protein
MGHKMPIAKVVPPLLQRHFVVVPTEVKIKVNMLFNQIGNQTFNFPNKLA